MRPTMKNALFARPNLTLILLAAMLLLCVQHVLTRGQPRSAFLIAPATIHAREVAPAELRLLMQEVERRPSFRAYSWLSLYFEQQGDYRRALQYLRKAETLRPIEQDLD